MDFFNKIKKGVTEAGTKAINTVEANRLKGLIAKNNEQIDSIYMKIGKKVFLEHQSLELTQLIENEIKQINQMMADNKQLEIDIKAIWNQKVCVCGNSVSLDSKFCSACGHRFDLSTIPEDSTETRNQEETNETDEANLQPNTTPEEKQDHHAETNICPNCDSEVESDAKFCGDCGHMLHNE